MENSITKSYTDTQVQSAAHFRIQFLAGETVAQKEATRAGRKNGNTLLEVLI